MSFYICFVILLLQRVFGCCYYSLSTVHGKKGIATIVIKNLETAVETEEAIRLISKLLSKYLFVTKYYDLKGERKNFLASIVPIYPSFKDFLSEIGELNPNE